jgi:hypothetical protein
MSVTTSQISRMKMNALIEIAVSVLFAANVIGLARQSQTTGYFLPAAGCCGGLLRQISQE